MDEESAGPVVIGMDPHKRTVTIEVMTSSDRKRSSGTAGSPPTRPGSPRCSPSDPRAV